MGSPSSWGECRQQWFSSDARGGVPCPCDAASETPCAIVKSSGVTCVGKVQKMDRKECPHDGVSCEDRQQLFAQRRVRTTTGKVFLNEQCPTMEEFRPCNNWAVESAEPDLGIT